jgi:hypothetical protein
MIFLLFNPALTGWAKVCRTSGARLREALARNRCFEEDVTMSRATYPLKLPNSVKKAAQRLAKEDGVSLNQRIAAVVAEKTSFANRRLAQSKPAPFEMPTAKECATRHPRAKRCGLSCVSIGTQDSHKERSHS